MTATLLPSFSSPDATPGGAPPSSDVFVYNLATGATSRVVNNATSFGQNGFTSSARPVSSAVSPDGQFLAYGVIIQQNQGVGNSQATKELNIVRVADSLLAANPTAVRPPTEDPLEAEFVGLSWDPSGLSFVTPTYVLIDFFGGFPRNLPAILRYARQPNGTFAPTRLSSTGFAANGQTAIFHIYPAISPSGIGLAYFQIVVPDPVFGT